VIRYEVLAKRRNALIIIGALHIERCAGKPGLVERQILSSFVKSYVITPGMSLLRDEPLDPRFRDWRRSHQSTFGLMIRQEPGVKPPTRIFTSAPWKR
jgi:hypothetical protein